MKKTLKKAIALILCFALLVPAAVLGVTAAEKKTDCGDDCE